jgi:pimeloyl-ACP methyl ester carboxylesterase
VWEAIATALVQQQGYRVLRYDFYDRGYSETDPTRYPIRQTGVHPLDFSLEMYVEQMRDVLEQLDLAETDFVHVGHSTGGVVGMKYASLYPNRVKGLVLVDTICLQLPQKPLAARLADLPFLGDWIIYFFGAHALIQFAKANFHDPVQAAPFVEQIARNAKENPRFFAAIRSTNKCCIGFVGSAEAVFRQVVASDDNQRPIHLIWGTADASVPYEHCRQLYRMAHDEMENPNVTVLGLPDMPHNCFMADTRPEECLTSITEFCVKVFQK